MTTSIIFPGMKTSLGKSLIKRSQETDDYALYLTYGKTDAWANDAAPNTAVVSTNQFNDVWNNMIGAKRLLGGDFSCVITRENWQSGTIYTAYDDKNTDLQNTKFYVVTDDFQVYKCIANANTTHNLVSTVKPTSISPYFIQRTSDGYAWKYMYTVPDSEQLRFTTDQYIPIKTLSADDGSIQWQVQEQAKSGSVEIIKMITIGSNYSNISNVKVTVSGDGTDFSGFAVSSGPPSNSITSIVIINSGRNYSYANVAITDISGVPGTEASARAIISPPGGHGSDPLYELFSTDIIINARFKYDEEGILPVVNDYRQIALVEDPLLNPLNNDIDAKLTSDEAPDGYPYARYPAMLQAYVLTTSGSGNYVQDEIVYQGASLEKALFTGRVVSWDLNSNKLLLINTKGSPEIPQLLTGLTSFTGRVITSASAGMMKPYTGHILYVNNLKPINRSSEQVEDFKILVKF